jgi:sugar/nucleoside kinase (ribokinase family)
MEVILALLVVGSIALDTVETPNDKIDNALGGSSSYISLAASYFTNPVHLIGVVGDDFPEEHIELYKKHEINIEGLEVIPGGKTFRWGGRYHTDMNVRDTLFTELGVFESFSPKIPEDVRDDKYVVLGNIHPALQLQVLEQLKSPELVVCDTMNLWIDTALEGLKEVIKKVDVLIINDSEAKMIAEEDNLIKAAKIIRSMGPDTLIIKKGEHGALLFKDDEIFSAAAYPLEEIFDPTGAGDTFAGGFAGYLSRTCDLSFENMKRAVIYGSAAASFCVEDFSTKKIESVSLEDIHQRFLRFKELTEFADAKL